MDYGAATGEGERVKGGLCIAGEKWKGHEDPVDEESRPRQLGMSDGNKPAKRRLDEKAVTADGDIYILDPHWIDITSVWCSVRGALRGQRHHKW